MKQVPLLYVLMSSKRKEDYRRILQVIQEQLSFLDMDCNVTEVVCDFEAAVWKAFNEGISFKTLNTLLHITRFYHCILHIQIFLFSEFVDVVPMSSLGTTSPWDDISGIRIKQVSYIYLQKCN